jgi:hypothetical protein
VVSLAVLLVAYVPRSLLGRRPTTPS